MRQTCASAVILMAVSVQPAFAQTAYVRSGASGSGTGTDWTNAYQTLPATLGRSGVYYVAGGTYAIYTFNDAASGTAPITVVKATSADHGTSVGWQNVYGDGAATFARLQFVSTAYVDVQGLVASGGIDVSFPSGGSPSATHHITLRNVQGQSLSIIAQDVLIQGGSFGGFNACDSDKPEDIIQVWQQADSSGVYRASTRVTFDGVAIHDVTDNGNQCAGLSTSGRHVDCMQILAGHFLTIRNSRFYNCATSGIMARPFRDTLNDLVVENSFFQQVMSPGASINFLGTGDIIGGTNIFRNNTIDGDLLINDASTLGSGASIQVHGNVLRGISSCVPYVTYSFNVFTTGSKICGSSSVLGKPQYVGPTPAPSYLNGIAPNYHLAATDTVAKNRGNPASYPSTDIDGDPRGVGGAPSAGADEFGGGTSSPPAAPTNLRIIP